MKPLHVVIFTAIGLFMFATVMIAIWQEDIGWGWWWVLPLGAGFVAAVIGFRLLIQRSEEAARRADEEWDESQQG